MLGKFKTIAALGSFGRAELAFRTQAVVAAKKNRE